VTQDHVDLADHQLEHVDLGIEHLEEGPLDRPRRHQVEVVDVAGLADAGQAANALLDPHRVPRQVIVHQPMGEL
jgi:hypothetical protein